MKIVTNYFGGCPECGDTDGYLNVGKNHWFFCVEHKTKWCVGSNLFSSWQDETEDDQRKNYEEIGMGNFREVAPLPESIPVYILKPGHSLEETTQEIIEYASKIISAGFTAIREAGDRELSEVGPVLATTKYFKNDPSLDAVATLLSDAIDQEIERRKKPQPAGRGTLSFFRDLDPECPF